MLKKRVCMQGYQQSDEVVVNFWKAVRSWPDEKKSRLLQFATGTSRIPVNGFKDLQGSDGPRRFTIEKSGDVNGLVKSHTCFNRLDLPYVALCPECVIIVLWVLADTTLGC
jgi:E3 ubiquitin-protein ligase NEDD4